MAVIFPTGLVPRSVLFDIENVSRGGGVSTNGDEQFVGSGVGRWTASLSGIRIKTTAQVLAWRAFKAALRGRAGTVLVPVFDGKRANWPVDNYGRSLAPGHVRRRRLDGGPFADPEIPAASAILAILAAPAPRRSTTVQMAVTQGKPIRAGQYFSPVPGRLHLVTEVIGPATFRIEPPLREAVVSGQAVEFARPTCTMRLASDDSGSLELELLRSGSVSPSFVEVV